MTKFVSFFSLGIKQRLMAAVCLMSIIPILICLNFIFPSLFTGFISKSNLAVILAIMFFIALLGFIIAKQIIDPIVRLSQDARIINSGSLTRDIEIKVKGDDEIGQLGAALNQLAAKIKDGMNQLEDYGSKTSQINLEIQKRIIVMSILLQITTLITQGENLEIILNVCAQKLKDLADSSLGFILFLEEGKFNLKAKSGGLSADEARISFPESEGALAGMFKSPEAVSFDANNANSFYRDLLSLLKMKSLFCLAVSLEQGPVAIVGIGSDREGFIYNRQRGELLDIFAKQIAVAAENYFLAGKIKTLEVKDSLTGLYNERYIRNHLDEEIKRAVIYQRPCGLILFKTKDSEIYRKTYGTDALESLFKKVALSLNSAFTGVERLGRFGEYDFAVVLPEKNKRQSQKTAEDILKIIDAINSSFPPERRLRIEAGVAENPLDGMNSQELIAYAQDLLKP